MKTIQRTRCSSCGSPDIRWLIFVVDGSKTKWCEECAFQVRIRLKRDADKHMKFIGTRDEG